MKIEKFEFILFMKVKVTNESNSKPITVITVIIIQIDLYFMLGLALIQLANGKKQWGHKK